jgi:hypothetical protein
MWRLSFIPLASNFHGMQRDNPRLLATQQIASVPLVTVGTRGYRKPRIRGLG